MIRRLVQWASSLKVTLFLIVALSLLFLLGLWIPQKDLLRRELYLQWKAGSPTLVAVLEALGFTDIYTSPLTLTLWVLFFLNLALVMWKRIPVIKRKVVFFESKREDPVQAVQYRHKASIDLLPGQNADTLPAILRKEGYLFYGVPKRFYAVKNRFSPVATLLFHLSFFLMLLGGVISVYTRFSGKADIAEGEVFRGELRQYYAPPAVPKVGSLPKARFMVERIQPIVEHDVPTGLVVRIVDDQGKRHVASINRPYKKDHTSFVLQNLGMAPLIIIQDEQGKELDGAFVRLNVLQGKEDAFSLAGLDITAQFFPDYVFKNGTEGTRTQNVVNPAFRFHVEKDKKFIARKTVLLGERIAAGDYRIHIPEMRYWVRFYIVRERGLGIIYTGFAVATAALIWRLVFYRRELVGSVTDQDGRRVLTLAGRAEFYRALFEDEFNNLVGTLKDRLGER